MGWTKRQYIERAYSKIGMAGYVFDLEPEQLDLAVSELDSMMAEWNAIGIRVGYPIGSSPSSNNVDQATSVPDAANVAIFSNLALRLAPDHGKTPAPTLMMAAKSGYTALLNRTTLAIPVQMPGYMIAGQGHRRYGEDRVFLNAPVERIDVGPDSQLDDIDV